MTMDATAIENTPIKKGLTLEEAAAQLKANRMKAQGIDPEELEDEDVEVVEEDVLEDEDVDADELDDEDEDSDDDDQDEDSDEEEGEEDDEEDIWEIDIEGEIVEVTTDELHKGYLRHNDYTRKRQADAKKAKDLETEYNGKLEQLNTALAQNIAQDERQLIALNQQYQQTQDEAVKRNLHYQALQVQQAITARKQGQEQALALQKQSQQAAQEAYWKEQEEMLEVQFENWSEKKEELKGYLEEQGFEDLSMFAHASMASIVDKAKQFDELQQKRKSVAKKKIKRKVGKVLKGGQGEKKFAKRTKQIKDLEARFAKTGSIKDAQALMRARRK